MNTSKKELAKGIVLLISFSAILLGLFSPVFNGQNPVNYFDDLYNSISKGSVYYIPKLLSKTDQYGGKDIKTGVGFRTDEQAKEMIQVYRLAGLQAEKAGNRIIITSDLARLLTVALHDADTLFHNRGSQLSSKYRLAERSVLYTWWVTLKHVEKELNKGKRFEEAKFVNSVVTKAVECSYNYYKIKRRRISDEVLFVVFSLAFYIIYTLWFGYAIMYIFIGLGLRLEH